MKPLRSNSNGRLPEDEKAKIAERIKKALDKAKSEDDLIDQGIIL
jgi:poly-gamma-glutamate capsule biosynthesis protein CapA/YwtB (metallophosphatase superfamily)